MKKNIEKLKENKNSFSFFFCLPQEIIFYIITDFLEIQHIINLSMVCKNLYLYCQSEYIWEKLCFRDKIKETPIYRKFNSFKDLYKQRIEFRLNPKFCHPCISLSKNKLMAFCKKSYYNYCCVITEKSFWEVGEYNFYCKFEIDFDIVLDIKKCHTGIGVTSSLSNLSAGERTMTIPRGCSFSLNSYTMIWSGKVLPPKTFPCNDVVRSGDIIRVKQL